MNIIISKNNYNIETINSEFQNYCSEKCIDETILFKMQLISEEFLTNILFPNFDGEVKISTSFEDNNIALIFEYADINYMKNINEATIISHKLIEKQTQEITEETIGNNTKISFIIQLA